jgi:hypothetical protein
LTLIYFSILHLFKAGSKQLIFLSISAILMSLR